MGHVEKKDLTKKKGCVTMDGMTRKTIHRSFRLDAEAMRGVERISEQTGMSMTKTIEMLLAWYLDPSKLRSFIERLQKFEKGIPIVKAEIEKKR